jgi:single-stranded-DNA-specific exonuclease
MWELAPVPPAAAELEAAGYPSWQAGCLARRGVADAAQAAAFLAPAEEQLSSPELLPGITAAADRLAAAAAAGERVAIVGDYDVDGVSATALLTAVLEACGAEVLTILPHRMEEGYGFHPAHVERAHEAGCSVLVTADCGSSAPEAAAAALAAGLDLIVTDHHLATVELPPGVLEVNPRRAAGPPGSEGLCAAGVAFKLVEALAARRNKPIAREALLRVACLGTVADMVPLRGENRVIAALGLAALPATPSPGLQALMARSRVRLPLRAADIGFRIGPRINAAGRMGDADPALELLLTRDPARARQLADVLEERNRTRREAQTRVEDEARARFSEYAELPPILVAWAAEWHRGVVGIAAGRLAREFHRPTILLSVDGESAGGSGRSIAGIELFELLRPWSDRLRRFGGHAQAIGLTADTAELETLRSEWEREAAGWPDDLLRRRTEYELELRPEELTLELVAELETLGPFGVGNRTPLARLGPLRLCAPPRLFGAGHLELRAVDPAGEARLGSGEAGEGDAVTLIGWSWQEREEIFAEPFEVVGVPFRDRYRGPGGHDRDRAVLRLSEARRIAPASRGT